MPPKKSLAPTVKTPASSKPKPPLKRRRAAVKAKGVQKPPKRSRRKQTTETDPEAMTSLPWPTPEFSYLELRSPSEEEARANNGYVDRHFKKAPKDYNGSEIKISEPAYERLMNIYLEIEKRTPDTDGHVRRIGDYDGYAIIEVIEGQILDYAKQLEQTSPCEFRLFVIAEALAFFLDGTYDNIWFGVDDGELVEALMNLIGLMFVDCFRRLDRDRHPLAHLLSPPELSPFKNLGLVMGLAVGFAELWVALVCEDESVYWAEELLRLAKARGIKLRDTKSPIGDDEGKDGDRTSCEVDDKGGDMRDSTKDIPPCEDRLDFTKAFTEYKEKHGDVGGSYYDLTKPSSPE